MDIELAECARINFENLEKAMPAIKFNPYYAIAKSQLDEALGGISVVDALSELPTPEREEV